VGAMSVALLGTAPYTVVTDKPLRIEPRYVL
jgi:hypothetical protein